MSNPNHTPYYHQTPHNNSYHDPQQIADYIDSATLPLHELYGPDGSIHARQPTISSTTTTTTGPESPLITNRNHIINDKLILSNGKKTPRTNV